MTQAYHSKSLRNFVSVLLILGLFIVGFQVLNKLYTYKAKTSYVTILNNNLLSSKTVNSPTNPFEVNKVINFVIPYGVISDFDLLDLNRISFVYPNPDVNSHAAKIGFYDLAQGILVDQLDQKDQIYNYSIQVSPNGKMLLISDLGKSGLSRVYFYDVTAKKTIDALSNMMIAKWLPENNEFVGVDDYLFLKNVVTGKRDNLFKLSDYLNLDKKLTMGLNILNDGQRICLIQSKSDESTNIISININTQKITSIKVKGAIYKSFPLGGNNLAYIGTGNGINGLFSCDLQNDTLKQLINLDSKSQNQKFGTLCISPDSKKIAYTIITAGGINEIHVAALDDAEIANDVMIFQDTNYIQKLLWTKDSQMLYFLQRKKNNSVLSRVIFKTP